MNEVCFQKRKRGRPRKLYDCINDYHHENEVQNDTLQEKIVCSTIFKRRLRRRSTKIATCSDTFVGKTTNDDTCMVKLPLDTNGTIGNKINPINKDNLINKIDGNKSLQKNKRRQSKIILPSDEFHNENEQELHVSSVDNSIVSTPEKYSENKDNNKEYTNEKNLNLICIQKKRGRPSKLKNQVSKNEHNNFKINTSNTFCVTSKICLENNDISKSILELNNVPEKRSNRRSILMNCCNEGKISHDKYNYLTMDVNINKFSTENTDTIQKHVYTEIEDSIVHKDEKNERYSNSEIWESVSIERTNERVICEKANSYLTLETNINKYDTSNKNSMIHDDINKESTVSCSIQKKRRGRPSKVKTHGLNTSSTELVSDDRKSSNIKSIVDETRTSDDSYSTTNDNENNSINHRKKRKYPFNKYKERKRGRPKGGNKKSNCDDDYVPHHSQVNQSLKKGNLKLSSTESSVKKMVSCGKCNVEILKSQWSHHNLSLHNDLGWVKGTTKPNFENDEKLLKRILFNAIKRRKGNLICEICNVIKRSVLGFLSHTTFCGKDEEEKRALMVTCPICDAVTKPSSLEYHERMHKLQTEEKQKTNFSEADDINLGSKIKRKAAEKAITKISQFTAIVNDKDDKDCSFSSDKKLKLNFSSVKKLIQKPQLMKKIPSTLLGKWKKNLNIGEYAICNQAGCQFNSKSLNEIKQHYAVCNFTPQENFSCKICQFQTLSENEIVNHALQKHSTEDNCDIHLSLSDTESFSSDNIDEIDKETEKNPGLQKKFFFKESIKSSNKIFRFLFKDGVCHTKLNKPFYTAFQWTLEFEKKNYKFNLFKELVPNTFKLLSVNESKEYFPIIEQSMLMKSEKTNNEDLLKSKWKKWKRFEGHCIQDNPTFFAGGPIWALAWLPIPSLLAFSKNISQFIAVSTHPTMDIEFSVGKIYTKKNIIQIWNFGDLNNKTSNMYNPKLAYAIIHEGGTVWCLDWCPSGCYQHEQLPGFINKNGQPKRMGLLAAACSDGCVRIYSLIFPEDLPSYSDCNKTINNFDDKNVENIYPIYNTEPVLQLIVNLEMFDQKQQIWQVTKLSWTKENEHNVIVAGFSNGYIALWDLTSKSSMLKTIRGNTIFLNSYRHFFAHHHAITMAYLIPQDNKRFLATASLDRHYKFWDLEDITNPRNFLKKSFVTDGSWLNNWHCALIAYDDALSMNHSYSYCLPLREYTYKYYNLLPTNSTSYTISTSDFGNSIANGTLAGEVLAIFPEQLLYIRDMDKTLPRKRHISIVSSLELIDFQSDSKSKESVQTKKREKNDNIDYNYMPSTYIDSNDRFGLKFCDKINFFRDEYSSEQPKNHKKTLTCEMMKNVPIEQYPFTSVNRLAWNPNAWSFLWLAVGYQNGFVRLISFKSLASTEYNKLLISHIETIKSDE